MCYTQATHCHVNKNSPMSVFFNQRQFLAPFIWSLHNWCYVTSLRLIFCTFLEMISDESFWPLHLQCTRSLREFGKNLVWQDDELCHMSFATLSGAVWQNIFSLGKIWGWGLFFEQWRCCFWEEGCFSPPPPPQIGLKATVNLQTKQSHKSSTGCFVDRKLWFTFFSEYKLEVPWIWMFGVWINLYKWWMCYVMLHE